MVGANLVDDSEEGGGGELQPGVFCPLDRAVSRLKGQVQSGDRSTRRYATKVGCASNKGH
jgi:hypothetical protein